MLTQANTVQMYDALSDCRSHDAEDSRSGSQSLQFYQQYSFNGISPCFIEEQRLSKR